MGDTHAYSMYGFDRWAELEYDDQWQENADQSWSFASTLTSNNDNWQNVKWQRKIVLSDHRATLVDKVDSGNQTHVYTLLYTLAPGVEVNELQTNCSWQLKKGGLQAELRIDSNSIKCSRLVEISNCQQRIARKALQLQVEFAMQADLDVVSNLIFK